jgi:hypothetical protein
MSTEETTIDSLPEDALKYIMLRLPTPAPLVRAASVSKSWRRIIAAQRFLGEYRERHPSSPFIGLYIPQEFGGLPSFLMADSIRGSGDNDLVRAAEKACLGALKGHPEWRLLDCHNGRLLLARGVEAIEVYSPLAREGISLCLPQNDCLPVNFSACLLQGHGGDVASFRVVSVQHHRRSVRAIEYDSRTKVWTNHPWKTLHNIEGSQKGEMKMMHAGGLIFCKCKGSSLLLLDTSNIEFSSLPLPQDNNPNHYAIGEMADGVCCLVSVDSVGLWNNIQLGMWKLENLGWKLEKQMQIKQVIRDYAHYSYYNICLVTNGIALLYSVKRHLHFVIDLKTFSMKEKFEFNDKLDAYPLQMPWPPSFSVAAGNGEQSTPSVAHKDLGIEEPNVAVLTPAQKEGCFDKVNNVRSNYDQEISVHSVRVTAATAKAGRQLNGNDEVVGCQSSKRSKRPNRNVIGPEWG